MTSLHSANTPSCVETIDLRLELKDSWVLAPEAESAEHSLGGVLNQRAVAVLTPPRFIGRRFSAGYYAVEPGAS